MIRLVQLYTCTVQLCIVIYDEVGTTVHLSIVFYDEVGTTLQLYCTTVCCSLWSGWYNCTPVLYNCLMFSMVRLVQLYTCTVQLSNVLYHLVDTTVNLYCKNVYCSLWSGWYNCTPVLYNCVLLSMMRLVQLYTCQLFSMMRLVQLYNCTVKLSVALYDQVDTTAHLYCTTVYCSLWSGWYNYTPVLYNCLLFSIIRLVHLCPCSTTV